MAYTKTLSGTDAWQEVHVGDDITYGFAQLITDKSATIAVKTVTPGASEGGIVLAEDELEECAFPGMAAGDKMFFRNTIAGKSCRVSFFVSGVTSSEGG